MTSNEDVVGTAMLCDAGGLLEQVLHDSLGIASGAQPGRPFTQFIDPACLGKALTFLADLRAQGAAFDWELTVSAAGDVRVLHFTGLVADAKILIVAAPSDGELLRCMEDLIRLGGEQATALRRAIKHRTTVEGRQTGRATALYDELSRLNNELVTLQRELAKANAELEALIGQKNQFLGMAAHDLRNPLLVIQSCASHLLAEASPSLRDEQIEFLSVIESYSGFMLQMIEDLLDVSAIESGKLVLSPRATDLVDLIERNLAFNSVLAATKEIRLTFRQSGDPPLISLDPVKVEQVLNNLVSNAIKYSYPGSSVELRLEQQADQIVISVKDQGQGIPPEELDRLFKWFGRTSVRATAGERSTGLGLAISRRIVAEHQGRMWVDSEVDKGSIFSFSLPISFALPEAIRN